MREDAGVRGPQSISILYPHDGKKLVQVCRGIKGIQELDSNMNSFQMEIYVKKSMLFMPIFLIC